jgi:hypothetical protein
MYAYIIIIIVIIIIIIIIIIISDGFGQSSYVGLIPSAVGSTLLREWAPDYLPHIPLPEPHIPLPEPSPLVNMTNSSPLYSPLLTSYSPSLSSPTHALPPPPQILPSTNFPSISIQPHNIPHCDSSGLIIYCWTVPLYLYLLLFVY